MGCTDVGVLVGVLEAGGFVAGALAGGAVAGGALGGVALLTVSAGDAGAVVVPV